MSSWAKWYAFLDQTDLCVCVMRIHSISFSEVFYLFTVFKIPSECGICALGKIFRHWHVLICLFKLRQFTGRLSIWLLNCLKTFCCCFYFLRFFSPFFRSVFPTLLWLVLRAMRYAGLMMRISAKIFDLIHTYLLIVETVSDVTALSSDKFIHN